jgi:hypothetical protein
MSADDEQICKHGFYSIVTKDSSSLEAMPLFGSGRLGIQHADNAIGITDGGDLRVDHDNGCIRMLHRQRRFCLDPGRAIRDHLIKLRLQLGNDTGNPGLSQAILVQALRSGQKSKRVNALVPDQRLGELRLALDDVDQV